MGRILLLSLLAACLPVSADDIETDISAPCQAVNTVLGRGPEVLVALAGEPLRRLDEPVENLYQPDARDRRVTLQYAGGQILYRYMQQAGVHVLLHARLEGALSARLLGESLPATLDGVIGKYGRANEYLDGAIRYYCSIEANEWVDVHYRQGDTSGIEFSGYLD